MPNPTTNPTRLSRTAREVAWNPLPGDAVRFPGGDFKTMSSAPNARERFLKALAQAPAGSTIRPYDGLGFYTGAYITHTLISRDMGALRAMHVYLPEILDRWMCSGDGRKSEALTALDFTADIPEAPFVHHAANILHCMVKFGAPAFVAAKPARDPRNNPQPGDTKTIHWADGRSTLYYDARDRHEWPVHMGVKTAWACGEAPAKAPEKPSPTNPTRLSRTAQEVMQNPLPGDAVRFPSTYQPVMSSSKFGEGRFREYLASAPAGSTILPYRAERLDPLRLRYLERFLSSLLFTSTMPDNVELPEMLDRALRHGQVRAPHTLAALDFTANLPEAPFVHHAANVLHGMVKFGAPAFVPIDWAPAKIPATTNPVTIDRRCPRTDPRPGDICILTNDEVEVFTDGTSKEVWRIGGPRIRWIRAEDVVRG